MIVFWYRCDLCSPNQSQRFEYIEGSDMMLSDAYNVVYRQHLADFPECPSAKGHEHISVEFLIRRVQ